MADNVAGTAPTHPRPELSIDQRLALKSAAVQLQSEFGDMFGVETIERFLPSCYEQFATGASIANFLPLLAERFARQRLRALAKVEGKSHDGKPVVLVLCTHNAGRSQMAVGFSPISPVMPPSPGREAPSRATKSTLSQSARCPRSASTSRMSTPIPGPTRSLGPPTLSSPWAAVMPARCSRAGATRSGSLTTPPARTSTNGPMELIVRQTEQLLAQHHGRPADVTDIAVAIITATTGCPPQPSLTPSSKCCSPRNRPPCNTSPNL